MLGVKKTLITSLIAVIGVLALSGTAVQAASECKGLSQAECGTTAECKWVEGYTRKDGKEVSGYCRSVAKKPEQESAPKPAQ